MARRVIVLSCIATMAMAGFAQAQEHTSDSLNDANNPLTPKITVNFQDYYVPSIIGTGLRHGVGMPRWHISAGINFQFSL